MKTLAIPVPFNPLLKGIEVGGRQQSIVFIDLHPEADADRFALAADAARNDLFAALLLRQQAALARQRRAPWADATPELINAAGVETTAFDLSASKAKTGRAQHDAADDTTRKKNEKRDRLQPEFAPFFAAAWQELRLTKAGAPRKRIADDFLAEVARKHAKAADQPSDFRALMNATAAAEWRAKHNR